MPKFKTSKTAQKRFKKTKTGKILRSNISAQHLARKKSKRTKKNQTKKVSISKTDKSKLKKMLPNV
jgi:large subunit ribosomal protein L35